MHAIQHLIGLRCTVGLGSRRMCVCVCVCVCVFRLRKPTAASPAGSTFNTLSNDAITGSGTEKENMGNPSGQFLWNAAFNTSNNQTLTWRKKRAVRGGISVCCTGATQPSVRVRFFNTWNVACVHCTPQGPCSTWESRRMYRVKLLRKRCVLFKTGKTNCRTRERLIRAVAHCVDALLLPRRCQNRCQRRYRQARHQALSLV